MKWRERVAALQALMPGSNWNNHGRVARFEFETWMDRHREEIRPWFWDSVQIFKTQFHRTWPSPPWAAGLSTPCPVTRQPSIVSLVQHWSGLYHAQWHTDHATEVNNTCHVHGEVACSQSTSGRGLLCRIIPNQIADWGYPYKLLVSHGWVTTLSKDRWSVALDLTISALTKTATVRVAGRVKGGGFKKTLRWMR